MICRISDAEGELRTEIAMTYRKLTKLVFTAALLALFMLAATGCTTFDNFKGAFIDDPEDTSNAISIGVYEPLTGAYKDSAQLEISGIELAHEMYGEVDGRKINLVYADNSSNTDAAETAIVTLLSKKPSVVLGSYGNIYSLLAGEYVQEAKTPAIAMTNTNPLITQNNRYYFRVCYIDATQGRLLARYLDSIKKKKAGILLPEQDDAAMAMATAFRRTLQNLTDNDDAIKAYEKYTTGDKDFSEQLEAIRRSGVEYVLLPGETTDAVNIIAQAEKMHLDVTFLGDMSWGEESFLESMQKQEVPVQAQHLAFVQFFASDGTDKKSDVNEQREAFLKAYEEKYGAGQTPDEAVALGYDAYLIAVDAIQRAETSSASDEGAIGDAIRDVLLDEDYSFEGASGSIRFNQSGDPKKTAYISTWEGSTIKAIYTIEASEQ